MARSRRRSSFFKKASATPKPAKVRPGSEVVGKRLKVWWPADGAWYAGRVASLTAGARRTRPTTAASARRPPPGARPRSARSAPRPTTTTTTPWTTATTATTARTTTGGGGEGAADSADDDSDDDSEEEAPKPKARKRRIVVESDDDDDGDAAAPPKKKAPCRISTDVAARGSAAFDASAFHDKYRKRSGGSEASAPVSAEKARSADDDDEPLVNHDAGDDKARLRLPRGLPPPRHGPGLRLRRRRPPRRRGPAARRRRLRLPDAESAQGLRGLPGKGLSEVQRQWWAVKSTHFDPPLFKIGKFYEMYHMDADAGVSDGASLHEGRAGAPGFPSSPTASRRASVRVFDRCLEAAAAKLEGRDGDDDRDAALRRAAPRMALDATTLKNLEAKRTGELAAVRGVDDAYDAALDDKAARVRDLDDWLKDAKREHRCPDLKYKTSAKDRYCVEVPEQFFARGRAFEHLPAGWTQRTKTKKCRSFLAPDVAELVEALEDAEKRAAAAKVDQMRSLFAAFDKERDRWAAAVACVGTLDALLALAHVSRRPRLEDGAEPFVAIDDGAHPCSRRRRVGRRLDAHGRALETAAILKQASAKSLVILDELGRGTATWDGAAIAHAVVHHLVANSACALFATHYHDSPPWAGHSDVQLGHMDCLVDPESDTVVFLYKLTDGCSPKSFGINVAKLAKLPKEVLDRAAAKSAEFEAKLKAKSQAK
ncbi:hypothetical protein JL721_7027 [Aureococcus anophagefferens]|nr:hypothetical protein JL721_7027 [Aureococcus anophagefferens]